MNPITKLSRIGDLYTPREEKSFNESVNEKGGQRNNEADRDNEDWIMAP